MHAIYTVGIAGRAKIPLRMTCFHRPHDSLNIATFEQLLVALAGLQLLLHVCTVNIPKVGSWEEEEHNTGSSNFIERARLRRMMSF